MILNLVKPVYSMLKVKEVNIYYNAVFAMHTKLTVTLLFVFSILASAYGYFGGKPIHCKIDQEKIQVFAEIVCWVNGTFTTRDVKKIVNGRVTWETVTEYQKYYQWISIVLVLQSALFYIPAYMWKSWERGRISQLCDSSGSPGYPLLSAEFKRQKNQIVDYLRNDNSRTHGTYVMHFVICEIMNFLIVIANMVILDVIFNRFWARYLPVVSSLFTTQGISFSTLADDLFPKVAKCSFTYTGPSGSQSIRDALCVLSLNILNEKVFAFLYVWFILLLIASGCNLVTRSVILLSARLRMQMMRTLVASDPLTKRQLQIILHGDSIGEWFVLFLLGNNLNPFIFREILDDVTNSKLPLTNNFERTNLTICNIEGTPT